MPRAAAYFAVARGRQAGIYRTWPECQAQVNGYSGAVYKKFPTEEAAQQFVAQHHAGGSGAAGDAVLPKKRSAPEDDDASGLSSSNKARHTNGAASGSSATGSSSALSLPNVVTIYCDGAATGNGQSGARAGWGVWFADEGQPLSELNESRRLPGSVQTNNRGELMAIVRALQLAPLDCQVVIRTDSQYSISCITSWQAGWRKKGWKRSNGEDVQNRDLIRLLEREMRKRKPRPKLEYVKGHAGHYGNERADHLATSGAAKPAIPESEWFDAEPSDSEPEGEVRKILSQAPGRSASKSPASSLPSQQKQGSSMVRSSVLEESLQTTESEIDSIALVDDQQVDDAVAPTFLPATQLMAHRFGPIHPGNDQDRISTSATATSLHTLGQLSCLFNRRSPNIELKPMPRPPPLASLVAENEEDESMSAAEMSRTASPPPPPVTVKSPSPFQEVEPPPPSPPRAPPPPLLTSLPSLDAALARGGELPGLPPQGALEIIGPTSVGKSKLVVHIAARCRVDALLQRREEGRGGESTSQADAPAEDCDQVLIIDTEGSLTEEAIETAVDGQVAERLSDVARSEGGASYPQSPSDLAASCLDGIYLVKSTSLPELMAILYLLSIPPSRTSSTTTPTLPGPLPPLHTLSTILIDSLSSPLRIPPGPASQRSLPRHFVSAIAELPGNLARINPHARLVVTNQMTLKMFTPQGELGNSKTPGSIAWMVPQVDAIGASLSGWNGVSHAEGEESVESIEGQGTTRDGGRGPGILGEAAQRVLMFRDGHSRYVQRIHPGSGAWIPFEIEGEAGWMREK